MRNEQSQFCQSDAYKVSGTHRRFVFFNDDSLRLFVSWNALVLGAIERDNSVKATPIEKGTRRANKLVGSKDKVVQLRCYSKLCSTWSRYNKIHPRKRHQSIDYVGVCFIRRPNAFQLYLPPPPLGSRSSG